MSLIKQGTVGTRIVVLSCGLVLTATMANAQTDPGPRKGAAGAGGPITGLNENESASFVAGGDAFQEVASVTGSDDPETEPGLGPRFNMTSCAACHAQPVMGGSSPSTNPQVLRNVAQQSQVAALVALDIISPNGPVREVRFSTDGGVHDLFTIMGLPGTPASCSISQPDFAAARDAGLLRFRIPTPTFGAGLIEAIEDATIAAYAAVTKPFGILGKVNRNGNDGTVTRFGWKAQNKSLVIFSGEAYNVEQGITNELFPDERGEGGVQDSEACRRVVPAPQDAVTTEPQPAVDDVNNFANFMRFLAPPVPVLLYDGVTNDQITKGDAAFTKAGCDVCHKRSMMTGNHANAALRGIAVNLFSDLLVHNVGTGDGITQGLANGNQFRTAPLWGAGQRLFFLHDGSKTDLVDVINAHGGEATRVINNFNGVSVGKDKSSNLTADERQNLVFFLRSL
jgi:CxxC motif-containing protein (DUF1111 family)